MKFSLDDNGAGNVITGYETGRVILQGQELTQSVIVTFEHLVRDWAPQSFEDLQPMHLEPILELEPEIIVLGSGRHQRFPSTDFMGRVWARGVGLEIMDTGAACRTYNILVSEGRKAAAALLMIEP